MELRAELAAEMKAASQKARAQAADDLFSNEVPLVTGNANASAAGASAPNVTSPPASYAPAQDYSLDSDANLARLQAELNALRVRN